MKTVEELRAAINRLKVGDAAALQVERDGELLYVALRIER
jgi:S1-C subfamily serine protease